MSQWIIGTPNLLKPAGETHCVAQDIFGRWENVKPQMCILGDHCRPMPPKHLTTGIGEHVAISVVPTSALLKLGGPGHSKLHWRMQTVVFWMSVLKAAVREHLGVAW